MWLNKSNARNDVQSAFYFKNLNLNFTVSEYDGEQNPIVYSKENSDLVNGREFNFLSHYYIQTHQGILLVINLILFQYFFCNVKS